MRYGLEIMNYLWYNINTKLQRGIKMTAKVYIMTAQLEIKTVCEEKPECFF